ncbi:MAG: hypothetical protein IJT68_05760 [Lentisphaeria bacterium]|nr:hypothetical protein [Lentisphaeria bacterium]
MKSFNLIAPFEKFAEEKLNTVPPRRLYPRLLAALILLGFLPLLIPGIPNGHDCMYHLSRLVTLREGFRAGMVLPVINYASMEGFGYGPGLFYSDLFFYPFGLLAFAGVPIVVAYKLFLVIWGLMTAFSMYWVAKRISGDDFTAFAASLLYCWSSYHAVDTIIRAACGEYQAFFFVPWCIYGFWNILYDEPSKRSCLPLAFGYAGLFYAHSITFVLMVLIGTLITVFSLPVLLRDIRRIGTLFCAGCLAAGLAAFAYVPLLEQILSLKFNLTKGTISSPVADRMTPFPRLFVELPFMKMEYWVPPGIGIIFVIVFLQRFRIKSERTPTERFRDLCMVTGASALVCATEFLPWQGMMRAIAAIQFPWRLYLPATAFGALGGGLLLGKLLSGRSTSMRRTWLWILLCGCGFPWWFLHAYLYAAKISEHELHRDITMERAARSILSGVHFLPQRHTNDEYDGLGGKAPITSDNPDAKTEVTFPSWGKLEVTFSGFSPGDEFEIPRIYYKGYCVETEEGGVIDMSQHDHFRFRPNASSGKAVVVYRLTKLHKASFAVSLLTLAGTLFAIWFTRRKQRRKQAEASGSASAATSAG